MNAKPYHLSDIWGFKEFAISCGAGISKNSGLPLANELKQHILGELPLSNEDIEEIMTSNLPFEAFMETISENTDISKILEIFQNGEPNTNHILIARLAKKGYLKTIVTTNFDLLIERALEKEGLKRNRDFEVYYDEEQFSGIDFEDVEDEIIRIFKIHGSIDNGDSIRTTMRAVASRSLSDKRMNVIRYLFSTGRHKKVLILGYSCSDEFDITPQIQSIEVNQKEIIVVEHSKEGEEIEDVRIKEQKNPFKTFPGRRIKCDADDFIRNLWDSLGENLGKYKPTESKLNWKRYLDDWIRGLKGEHLKYFITGSILYEISDFKKAIEYHKTSLGIAEAVGNKAAESVACTELGNNYLSLGNYQEAIEWFDESLEIKKVLGDKPGELKCYGNLGIAYRNLGDLKKGIQCHDQSVKIAEAIRDKQEQSTCYANLGNAYSEKGDFRKAIEYLKKSLEIKKAIGDKVGETRCYTGLGFAYHRSWDFSKAIEHHEKSLEIAKAMGDKGGESACYQGLGIAYRRLGDLNEAIGYHEKSLEIAKAIRDKGGESACCTNLGNAYYDLRDFKRAIEYYLKAEEVCKEIKRIHALKEIYRTLSRAYKKIGDTQKAKDYKRLSKVKDIQRQLQTS